MSAIKVKLPRAMNFREFFRHVCNEGDVPHTEWNQGEPDSTYSYHLAIRSTKKASGTQWTLYARKEGAETGKWLKFLWCGKDGEIFFFSPDRAVPEELSLVQFGTDLSDRGEHQRAYTAAREFAERLA